MALAARKEAEIKRKNDRRIKRVKPPSGKLLPDGISLRYSRLLMGDLRVLYGLIDRKVLNYVKKADYRLDSQRLDDEFTDTLAALFKEVWRLFLAHMGGGESGLENTNGKTALKIAKQTDGFNKKQFGASYRKVLKVDPLANEPWLRREMDLFTTDNINLIGNLQEGHLDRVQEIVLFGIRKGQAPSTIAKQISGQNVTTEKRARLIARDQVAKFNTGLEQKRAVHNGVTEYIWNTNKDGRERHDHLALDGTKQKWNNAPVTVRSGKRAGEKNHPGQDIQCRCWAENVYDNLLDL